MLLNALTNEPCHRLSEEKFYDVLSKLSSRGMDKVIMEYFESLFSRMETVQIKPEDLDRIDYGRSYKISR